MQQEGALLLLSEISPKHIKFSTVQLQQQHQRRTLTIGDSNIGDTYTTVHTLCGASHACAVTLCGIYLAVVLSVPSSVWRVPFQQW